MHVIADTGYLLAFLRENDEHHGWAAELARQVDAPVLTCEAVLAETAFHLNSGVQVLAMLQRRAVRVAFDCTSHLEQLQDLASRYSDRHPDLADLCIVRMSELYPRHVVLTVDESDFRVFRRNKREAIPLLCPPKK